MCEQARLPAAVPFNGVKICRSVAAAERHAGDKLVEADLMEYSDTWPLS